MPTLTETELLQALNQLKVEGNENFKKQNFQAAYETYQKAINLNIESNPKEYEQLKEELSKERLKEQEDRIRKENEKDSEKDSEQAKNEVPETHSDREISLKFQTLAILHQNSAACCQKLKKENLEAIDHCETSLDYNPCYVKNIRRLAELYYVEGTVEEISNSKSDQKNDDENSENDDESYASKLSAMTDNPKHNFQNKALEMYTCLTKLDQLTSREASQMKFIQEECNKRQEEMKQQMFTQLRSLGDMCLKPFGLSTNNFSLEDNGSGGYSMSFNK